MPTASTPPTAIRPAGLRGWITAHPLSSYIVLAFTLSWSCWIPMAVTGIRTGPGTGWPTHLIGLTGAALAAITVTAIISGRPGLRDLLRRALRWRVAARWYLVIAATAGLLALAPATRALTGDSLPSAADYVAYSGIATWPAATTVITALVLNGFGEELGWRGFLADRLIERYGTGRTALIVAPIWAAWHLPMFWVVASFQDFTAGTTVGWALGLTAGSLVLTWLYRASGRSVLIVAGWHTAFNFATATRAAAGVPAAVASTLVMAAALLLPAWELRRRPEREVRADGRR